MITSPINAEQRSARNQHKLIELIERFREHHETDVSSEFISDLLNDLMRCVDVSFNTENAALCPENPATLANNVFYQEVLAELSDICMHAMLSDPAGLDKLETLVLKKLTQHIDNQKPALVIAITSGNKTSQA